MAAAENSCKAVDSVEGLFDCRDAATAMAASSR
jgi:hypothetical protein